MVLISLSLPRLNSRFTLPILLGLMSACCFGQPVLLPVESTPYDNQMARIQPVLSYTNSRPADGISMSMVNQWLKKMRRVPYRYSKQWQTPLEVTTARAADCKGKAIALYEIMQTMGATNVRFVVGKHRAGDWFTHAWLEWETANGSYVLDPTFNWRAVQVQQLSSRKYVPLFVYDGTFRYRAVDSTFAAEMPLRAVASGKQN